MPETCIHSRTEKQKCAKCFRCVICGKPLNRAWDDYTVDYEGDVAHESCVKEKSTAQGLEAMRTMHNVRTKYMDDEGWPDA